MQDNQGNPLIKLPPVGARFECRGIFINAKKVEMIRMTVNLNDEARVSIRGL
jgi:hypothetical protein